MCYIPDYFDQWSEYNRQKEEELKKLPECCECGEAIQTEECFEINGELICPECLEENHKKRTEDYEQ